MKHTRWNPAETLQSLEAKATHRASLIKNLVVMYGGQVGGGSFFSTPLKTLHENKQLHEG